MAKHERDGQSKVKFRYIEFDVEGAATSIEEGLRNIAAALCGSGRTTLPAIRKRAIMSADEPSPASVGEGEVIDVRDTDGPVADAPNGPTRLRTKRVYATPKLLPALDLTGNPSLTDYLTRAGLTGNSPNSKRYLLIANWLQDQRSIASIGIDHIHTCYRFMSWQTPRKPISVFWQLQNKGWVAKADAPGEYSITFVGENEVQKLVAGGCS